MFGGSLYRNYLDADQRTMEPEESKHQKDDQGGGNPTSSDSFNLDPAKLFQDAAESSGLNQKPSSGGLQWEPPLPDELARWFPDMEITSIIGRGGMGAVYKAVQKSLGRIVAIKLLPEEFSQNEEFAERFRREAKTLGSLKHPNIVAIHNFGVTTAGHHYFVMEYVDGSDFYHYIRSGKLTIEKIHIALSQICDALQFAHKQGIVHRDIKPGNIFITQDGHIKVGDFGLAKIVRKDGGNKKQDNYELSLTGTGFGMGTVFYSAPEQLHGRDVDHRADIYSLGVMLYEMLTGQLPQGGFKLPSEKVKVDARMDDVVLRAIQEDPNHRYQNVAEFQSDLNLIQKGPGSGQLPKPVLSQKAAHTKPSFPLYQLIGMSFGFAALFVLTGFVIWWLFFNSDTPPVEPTTSQVSGSTNAVPSIAPAKPVVVRNVVRRRPAPSKRTSTPQSAVPATVQTIKPPVKTPLPVVTVSPVEDETIANLNLLDQQYLSALILARDNAVTAKQSSTVQLLREEIARIKTGRKVPDSDPPSTDSRLIALRNIWRREMAKGIPLINGIDFEGWSGFDENVWKVRDGAIWGSKGAPISQSVPFRHYEITGEIYVSKTGNGGIFLLGPNSPETPWWQGEGLEFAIVGSNAYESGGVWTGGFIEKSAKGLPNYETPDSNLLRDSAWTSFRVRVSGNGLESWIGGRSATVMPLYNKAKGISHIGLEAKNSLVGYRNLRIKEISN